MVVTVEVVDVGCVALPPLMPRGHRRLGNVKSRALFSGGGGGDWDNIDEVMMMCFICGGQTV